MSFEFYCPQGHLLEGDDEQLGTQGRCPICNSLFMFPKTTLVAAREKRKHDAKSAPEEAVPEPAPPEPVEPERQVLKVFCPNGHMLNTPEELLGTEVVCLKCKVRFTPTVERSLNYLRTKQRYESQKDATQGRFWLAVAILAVTVAVTVCVVAAVYLRRHVG